MWTSADTTHVYRGKGHPHRCTWCNEHLQEGQEYRRYIWRPRSKQLIVMIEHANQSDCPWEEMEAINQELYEESLEGVTIQMVITSKVVAKVALNGETVYSTEPFVEMESKGASMPLDLPVLINDTDDEIPF